MKRVKITIILGLLLLSFPSFSQMTDQVGVRERVYVATDRNSYIAGENVWCSVFCFDGSSATKQLSTFSSLAYLELRSNDGIVMTSKIALIEGRGAGNLKLPVTLPTGNYALIVYTKQNRNEYNYSPMERIISIFNVLTTERVKDNVIIAEEATTIPELPSTPVSLTQSSQIEVVVPEGGTPINSPLPLLLKNNSGEKLFLSVSVCCCDSLYKEQPITMDSYFQSESYIAKNDVWNKFVPDYEGEVIELQVTSPNMSKLKGANAFIAFPGRDADLYVSNINEDGVLRYYTKNIYGRNDIVCGIKKINPDFSWSAKIITPFINKEEGEIPQLHLHSSMASELNRRGINMQLGRFFDSDTLYQRMEIRPGSFLTKPNIVYKLDNYTRFSLMEEVINEFVVELKINKSKTQSFIKVLIEDDYKAPYFSANSSLVLLDGVPVIDHKKIINYDPLLVKEIRIFPNSYAIGNDSFEGVASFVTYKGSLPSFEMGNDINLIQFDGALVPLSFTGKEILGLDNYPDYRQTLYWNPIVEMNSSSTYSVECKTPMYGGKFSIVVEGVTSSGTPIYYHTYFYVR